MAIIGQNGALTVKTRGQLPPHITFEQYLELRNAPKKYFEKCTLKNKRENEIIARDELLIDFLWECGGRISDVLALERKDFNFSTRILTLNIKKTRSIIKINLSQELVIDIQNRFLQTNKEKLFDMTRQNAWDRVKKYGREIGLELNPHMFRHGLAVNLLRQQIPIRMISYRLGHKSVRTTAEFYLVITPELEREMFENFNVRFR